MERGSEHDYCTCLENSAARQKKRLGGGAAYCSLGIQDYTREPTQETPFNLVYGSEAVLHVEIGQTSDRIESYPDDNEHSRAMELDLGEEKREQAMTRMETYRGRVIKSYNKRVRIRDFQIGDLVIKKVNSARDLGKMEDRWEGPFRVIRRVSSRAFYLEDAQ
ncbi:uncharacterized protein LOC142550518 [Primulina tabacum]|uniref:uncharacterized protein LOC142550518 n=1 Tax=Primulina tabacum TaxID=48773 RepID=UPI003F59A3D1